MIRNRLETVPPPHPVLQPHTTYGRLAEKEEPHSRNRVHRPAKEKHSSVDT